MKELRPETVQSGITELVNSFICKINGLDRKLFNTTTPPTLAYPKKVLGKKTEETYNLKDLKERQSITVCRTWILIPIELYYLRKKEKTPCAMNDLFKFHQGSAKRCSLK